MHTATDLLTLLVPSALALGLTFWLALRDDPDRERRRRQLREHQLGHHLHRTTTERR